jgi:hypothetical protein
MLLLVNDLMCQFAEQAMLVMLAKASQSSDMGCDGCVGTKRATCHVLGYRAATSR